MPSVAASLAWGLIKNHAFLDGNKRIGMAVLATSLDLNGFVLTCASVEETAMVLGVAASEIDESEWTAWVERVSAAVAE